MFSSLLLYPVFYLNVHPKWHLSLIYKKCILVTVVYFHKTKLKRGNFKIVFLLHKVFEIKSKLNNDILLPSENFQG